MRKIIVFSILCLLLSPVSQNLKNASALGLSDSEAVNEIAEGDSVPSIFQPVNVQPGPAADLADEEPQDLNVPSPTPAPHPCTGILSIINPPCAPGPIHKPVLNATDDDVDVVVPNPSPNPCLNHPNIIDILHGLITGPMKISPCAIGPSHDPAVSSDEEVVPAPDPAPLPCVNATPAINTASDSIIVPSLINPCIDPVEEEVEEIEDPVTPPSGGSGGGGGGGGFIPTNVTNTTTTTTTTDNQSQNQQVLGEQLFAGNPSQQVLGEQQVANNNTSPSFPKTGVGTPVTNNSNTSLTIIFTLLGLLGMTLVLRNQKKPTAVSVSK